LLTSQWDAILRLGEKVEEALQQREVGLRMGGEPTFVALDALHLPEWQVAALGEHKWQIALSMLEKSERFVPPGFLLQYGSGKIYPGEVCPRWTLSFYWRTDGKALWTRPDLQRQPHPPTPIAQRAKTFLYALADRLDLPTDRVIPAYEAEADQPIGYVLPLLAAQDHQTQASKRSDPEIQDSQDKDLEKAWYWATCAWRTPQGQSHYGEEQPLTVFPGQSPVGLRLPLQQIDWADQLAVEFRTPLNAQHIPPQSAARVLEDNKILVALAVEVRAGQLCLFLPPMTSTCSFADLMGAIDQTAQALGCPIHLEGYGPPMNAGIDCFAITPDPGVIEVNVNPVDTWQALVEQTFALDEVAQASGLSTYKYTADGRQLGTGGGAHITIGGSSPTASPLLRRPELLRSIIAYWQQHPSLSYLFAGQFVGPTSQAPRVDEAHPDGLYELELAFNAIDRFPSVPPALIDHLFRPLLTDLTGNTHRAALCIDKLFPVDKSGMQLGLLEFRAFEMPHHPQLRLLQLLLVRAIVAWFWDSPYRQPPIYFETALQDRYFLPYFLEADFCYILQDLQGAGFDFQLDWFSSFFETRFPLYGQVNLPIESGQLTLELRHALELWPVLPEESSQGGTGRPVDDSLDRIQVRLKTASPTVDLSRYCVLCQGQVVPLQDPSQEPLLQAQPSYGLAVQPPQSQQQRVAAVRFRARRNRGIAHEATAPQSVLTFEVVDRQTGHALGGCTYHVNRPDGTKYTDLPKTAQAAAERMKERFVTHKSQPRPIEIPSAQVHPKYPFTLDLRWTVGQTKPQTPLE
jgi:uncharacterized protein (DUF2126 family)